MSLTCEPEFAMNQKKKEFINRVSKWIRGSLSEDLLKETDSATLDGLYRGRSTKIHRLILIAYHRGIRRGVGMVWDAKQPITTRDEASK